MEKVLLSPEPGGAGPPVPALGGHRGFPWRCHPCFGVGVALPPLSAAKKYWSSPELVQP